jgi:hypothetical protein
MCGLRGVVNIEGVLEAWQNLEAFLTEQGEPPFEPLSAEAVARLEERYDLGEPVRALFEAGWPKRPLLIGGADPFFWGVEELLERAEPDSGWPRAWFPFGIMSGFEVLCARSDAEEGDGVWAMWCEVPSNTQEAAPQPEGLVYKTLEAFIAAVRVNWQWIREEHLEAREAGWFLFKEQYPTLSTEAAEAIARTFAPYFKDGPAILPSYASYADLLEPPLNCIATPLDERF